MTSGLFLGIIRADDLDKAAVARTSLFGHYYAIERVLGLANPREPNH